MKSQPKQPLLTEEEAREKLKRISQEHVLAWWDRLEHKRQDHLLQQITRLDENLFAFQRSALGEGVSPPFSYTPYSPSFFSGVEEDYERGVELLSQGKCACLVLAGGLGSRLRFEGPKGCYPVSVVKKKSLFELVAEKVKAARVLCGKSLELAIMTSPLNHVETETFFAQHAFFGLDPRGVHFFYQQMCPFLDEKKNLFLQAPDRIAVGPNGNGGALHRLVEVGVWDFWKEKGVEMIQLIPIDNPLASPFDPELFGFHKRMRNAVTVKAIERENPEEDVGVLVQAEGRIHVIEYSELPSSEREAKKNAQLKYRVANLSLYCLDIDFVKEVSKEKLPLHVTKKTAKFLNEEGETLFPEEPNAWKFEQFIFDLLPFAKKVEAVVYPREECFAPLKNFEGVDSIETVQAALQVADRKAFYRVSGVAPPEVTFELAQPFHFPTEELRQKWKGKELPHEGYIEV